MQAVAAKKTFMEQSELLQGRIGMISESGNEGDVSSGLGGNVAGVCWRL